MERNRSSAGHEKFKPGIAAGKPPGNRLLKGTERKGRVIMALINHKRNEELLEGMPHMDFLDLACVYRIAVSFRGGEINTTPVSRALMGELGWTQEEMHAAACENTARLLPLKVEKLNEKLYMVTNGPGLFGAAAILCPEVLESLEKRAGGSFYAMLPSIHEAIIAAEGASMPEGFLEMLKEANALYAGEAEWLSDSLYFYDAGEKEISVYKKILQKTTGNC